MDEKELIALLPPRSSPTEKKGRGEEDLLGLLPERTTQKPTKKPSAKQKPKLEPLRKTYPQKKKPEEKRKPTPMDVRKEAEKILYGSNAQDPPRSYTRWQQSIARGEPEGVSDADLAYALQRGIDPQRLAQRLAEHEKAVEEAKQEQDPTKRQEKLKQIAQEWKEFLNSARG